MAQLKIDQQITCLRKLQGWTQEELARKLGVTNQAVSKWEAGTCCPDIQLLPDIAACFKVSVDTLLGHTTTHSLNDVYLRIRSLFEESPAEDAFAVAYRLASILHEGACTKGYHAGVPWDTGRPASQEAPNWERYDRWGFSATSEPEGVTIHNGHVICLADNRLAQPVTQSQLLTILANLELLADRNTLKVIFAIYEMTVGDFQAFVSVDAIAERCHLPNDTVQHVLDRLPVGTQEPADQPQYRLEDRFMLIPPVLLLLGLK